MAGPISYDDLFNDLGPGARELEDFSKSVGALNRAYKAFGKNIDADSQRIAAGLEAIVAATSGARQQAAGMNAANEKERAAIAALSVEVSRLAREQEGLKKAQAGQAAVRKQTADATKAASSAVKQLQNELRAAFDAKDVERATKAALAIQKYKQETDQLTKALRGANSVYTATIGSYNNLSIATQQLGDKIRALPGGFDATSKEAAEMKAQFYANTQQLKDFDRELNQNFREVGAYARGIIEAVEALNKKKVALTSEVQALKMQANATHLSAEQQRKLREEIDRTEDELRKVTGELKSYGNAAKKGSDSTGLMSVGAAGLSQTLLGTYLSITGLIAGLEQVFEANAKFSDQLISVRKTTGLTEEATDALAESLKQIDTRTSLAGLLDIAKVGGQLGIAGKDIFEFTKAIDIASQALSDDFAGGAEQIATELGKISVVFRKELGPDQAQNIIRIGSAVNQLGAEGAATAPFLTDVALRTGAVAANARIGLKDVLAYAAVLQETGFSAEVSGTALNRLFNTLSTRSKASFEIAKLADSNLTLKEFKRLINTDFQGALTLFLRGLREGGTSTTKFNSLLGTLKLQSGEAKSVITTLAQNVELLTDKQATANDQLERGTSLGKEAALANNNLAGSWNKLKNDISNFFASGAGSSSLKWLVDATRASLNFKDGFGALFDGRLLGLAKKQTDDFGKSLADQALAFRKSADGTETLLARFESLRAVQDPSIQQQRLLRDTVLALKDRLGETAVVLNKQTSQWELNTVAVSKNLKATRGQYQETVTTLAKRLKAIDDEKAQSESLANAIQEEVTARELLVKSRVKLNEGDDFDAIMQNEVRVQAKRPERYAAMPGALSPETLKAYTEYVDLGKKAQSAADNAARAEVKRNNVLGQLRRLGLDAAGAYTYLIQATNEEKSATDDSIETDKKKKKAVADLAREQYELAKARLETRLTDLDRQAENPANSEAIRTAAIQKGKGVRLELAALERDELIRQAAKTYKDQIGGDKALGLARVRLSEQFSAKRLEIEQTGDKQLLALHNAILDQLAAVDKLQIENELEALELIISNESAGQQERTQAALDAAARRIEIAELEAASKIRAAKGDALEEKKILDELEKEKAAILARPRPFNAEFANDELAQRYTQDQLALENKLAAGLISQRDYYKEIRQLDDDYSAQRVRNLQRDAATQKQATEEELQRARDAAAERVRLRQVEGELIIESLQNLQQFSDSYFEIGNDKRQRELEDVQHTRDQQMKVAGENEELKAQIQENARRKELAIKQKQARSDKAAALFNVALNTGMAVTSVLSTGGGTRYADFGISAGVLSALVIAQGLAQAAAIAAKPIPQYYKGRAGGPAEWAWVGERGPELVSGRSGGSRLVEKPTLTYLQKDDVVHTATKTRDILAGSGVLQQHQEQRQYLSALEGQAADLRRTQALSFDARGVMQSAARAGRYDTDRVIGAINKLAQRPEYHFTEHGIRLFTRQQDHVTEHVNRYYRRNG